MLHFLGVKRALFTGINGEFAKDRKRLSLGPETRSTSIATTTPIVRENIEEAIGNSCERNGLLQELREAKRRAQRLAKKQYR